jgi:hypothetical protein
LRSSVNDWTAAARFWRIRGAALLPFARSGTALAVDLERVGRPLVEAQHVVPLVVRDFVVVEEELECGLRKLL